MKYLIIAFALSTSLSYAEICDDNSKLGSLGEFAGSKCFNDEVSPGDIEVFGANKSDLRNICQNCKNVPLEKIMEDADAQKETRKSYGKAILNEFQKELTVVSMDLMKLRSSFPMNFNVGPVVASCNINTNIKAPKCLKGHELDEFKNQFDSIKNSLATELSDIISRKKSDGGLFKKRDNSCKIDDGDILYSHMRYIESLITPSFIAELKNLKLKNNLTFDKATEGKLTEDQTRKFSQLNLHPIFKSLMRDTKALNKFLDEASKLKNQDEIVENLYHDTYSASFSKNLKEQCSNMFSKTTKLLEEVHCGKSKLAVADDLASMEIVSGSTFRTMPVKKAENELKIHCALLASKTEEDKGFSQILVDIHGENKDSSMLKPLNEFRDDAYSRMFQNQAEQICGAQKEGYCEKDMEQEKCRLYKHYKDLKTNPNYQKLANQPNDNINQILQSLVGDGLPQKDGKVDTIAVKLLRDERIIPGGSTEPAPKKATASEFHKTVRSSGGGGATTTNLANTTSRPPEFKPVDNTTNSNSNSGSSTTLSNNNDSETPEASSTGTRKIVKSTSNDNFSALSDKEQQDILSRLKGRSSNKKSKTKNQDFEDDGNFVGENNQGNSTGTYTANSSGVNDLDNTRVVNPKALGDISSGKRVGLDPVKKVNSVNKALVDANTNRTIASENGGPTSPVVTVSKSKDKNEINIQVDDQELSRVSEFKDKLKVLLAAHNQELSVVEVGEKIIVKLNNYEIDVVFNKEKGFYEALPTSKDVPKDYVNTISYYFNVTLKEGKGKRNVLVDAFKPKK